MQLPSRHWADLTTHDFEQLRHHADAWRTVAVLPVAATEQHGPHLPLNVDTTIVDGVVSAALPHLATDCPVLVLPTQAVGLSPEHQRFPGTLTLQPATILALWSDLGASVAAAGVHKLLLFNAHGGQVSVMDIVARELRSRHNLMAWHSSWYQLPLGEAVNGLFSPHEHRFGIHAGDIETSLMLALQPEQVRLDRASDFPSRSAIRAASHTVLGQGQAAKLGWQMQDVNPCGAAGNAAAATAAKGQALLHAAGRSLAILLHEISALPLSTLVDQPRLSPAQPHTPPQPLP
jgi:creatinine amidohydrolase